MCICGDPMCGSCGPAQGFNPAQERFYDHLYATHAWLNDDNLDPDKISEVIDWAFEQGYEGKPVSYDELFPKFPCLMPYRLSQVVPLIAECLVAGQAQKAENDLENDLYADLDALEDEDEQMAEEYFKSNQDYPDRESDADLESQAERYYRD